MVSAQSSHREEVTAAVQRDSGRHFGTCSAYGAHVQGSSRGHPAPPTSGPSSMGDGGGGGIGAARPRETGLGRATTNDDDDGWMAR